MPHFEIQNETWSELSQMNKHNSNARQVGSSWKSRQMQTGNVIRNRKRPTQQPNNTSNNNKKVCRGVEVKRSVRFQFVWNRIWVKRDPIE